MLRNLQPNTQEPCGWVGDSPTKGNGKQLFWTKAQAHAYANNIWPLYAGPAPQAKPMTDAFAKAASEHGLTLVITVDGYKLMKCGPATAHGVKP